METQTEQTKAAPTCSCGRSPVGHCIGWHKLDEDEFREKLAQWEANVLTKDNLV
jgi:hypothetical protein